MRQAELDDNNQGGNVRAAPSSEGHGLINDEMEDGEIVEEDGTGANEPTVDYLGDPVSVRGKPML